MKYFVFANVNTGEINQVIYPSIGYSDGMTIGDYLVIEYESPMPIETLVTGLYYKAGEIKQRSPQPSPHHSFDIASESWIVTANAVLSTKIRKKRDIEAKRATLEISTIVYDGKNLDADAEAIKNINGKLQELAAKQALNVTVDSASLFWRDADNIIHTWADVETYKAWLQGLVIAIAERTSNLYQTTWQKKAELDALTDIEAVLAYDVEGGW